MKKTKAKRTVSFLMAIIMVLSVTFFVAPIDVHAYPKDTKFNDSIVMQIDNNIVFMDAKQTLIDENNPDATPVIVNGETYVPASFVKKASKDTINTDNSPYILVKHGDEFYSKEEIGIPDYILDNPSNEYIKLTPMTKTAGKHVAFDSGYLIISDDPNKYDPAKDKETVMSLVESDNALTKPALVPVGTPEKFLEIVGEPMLYGYAEEDTMYAPLGAPAPGGMAEAPLQEAASDEASAKSGSSGDYSETNTQVQGVDEADIIKTDGEYIYYIKDGGFVVVDAKPENNMEMTYSHYFKDTGFTPYEMYLNGKYMVIIGQNTRSEKLEGGEEIISTTDAIIYDTTNKKDIKQVREITIDGYSSSSRMVGDYLYIVTNTNTYSMWQEGVGYKMPQYIDTAVGEKPMEIGYKSIYYDPSSKKHEETSMVNVLGFSISQPKAQTKVCSYMGQAQNMYVSQNNMYITEYESLPMYLVGGSGFSDMPQKGAADKVAYVQDATAIHRFAMSKGDVRYAGSGKVPGTINDQFSMDEFNGNFRIATTSYRNDGGTNNNIYVLNNYMDVTGKIENIAPGERIYSTRFAGERAYMVTFKQVDPLFVIDLKDPTNPTILGQLKIPGFSEYLHPYDANHIMGFGKETVVTPSGGVRVSGMKMAMFDVTDVNNPKEMFSEHIGDAGTESELLYNHKALLFDKEKELLAFPVSVYLNEQGGDSTTDFAGNDFAFQGAYVYDVDLVNGFTKKGEITHLTPEDLSQQEQGKWMGESFVQRIIYIGDTLYTASNNYIKSTGMKDMKDKDTVDIATPEQYKPYSEPYVID